MQGVDRFAGLEAHTVRRRGAGLHDPEPRQRGHVGQVDVAAEHHVGAGIGLALRGQRVAVQQVGAVLVAQHGQRLVHDDHAHLCRAGGRQPVGRALDLRRRELAVTAARNAGHR